MKAKEELTKLFMESYAKGVEDTKQAAIEGIQKAILLEREACAKVCEGGVQNANDWDSSYWDQACENRAAAIRARGNT
jgi:hypothetical protein